MRTLTEIINKLEANPYPNGTYVGKNYNKLQLINDLKALQQNQPCRKSEFLDNLQQSDSTLIESGLRT